MSKKEKAPKEEKGKDAKAEEKDAKKPAEGEAPAEGAEGDAPKKSKKKLIIIILAAVLVLGGGGGAAFMLLGGKKEEVKLDKDGKKIESKDEKVGKDGKKEEVKLDKDGNPIKPKPVFYDMPDIIVNLNSTSPRPHFVNLKLTLELASEAKLDEVKNQQPRITDSFNTYLREVRREDLQGSAGTYRLKKELTIRLNKILGDDVVNDLLFREIIVQ